MPGGGPGFKVFGRDDMEKMKQEMGKEAFGKGGKEGKPDADPEEEL